MKILDLENAIIDHLKSQITGLHIEGYADDTDDFTLKHPAGAALVIYGGSNYTIPSSLSNISQNRKPTVDIILLFRNLRGHTGAYEYIDKIINVLTGYQVTGCSKMYPVRDDFIDEEKGVWRYGMTFELLTDNVEIA